MGNPVSDEKVELSVWEYFASDIWEQLKVAPARVAALERRVANLESKLARSPGEACPHCGALAMRLEFSERSRSLYAKFGAREETWRCEECRRAQVQTVYPPGMPRS
jgi:uncharacterized protein with PIN domain